MDFAALGAGIFATPDPCYYHSGDRDYAPPTIVYNTRTTAVAAVRPLPCGVPALRTTMAACGKLYALTNQVLNLQALGKVCPCARIQLQRVQKDDGLACVPRLH